MANETPCCRQRKSQHNIPLAKSTIDILDAAEGLMQLSKEHKENNDVGVSGSIKRNKISGEDEVDQRLTDIKVITPSVKRVKKYR